MLETRLRASRAGAGPRGAFSSPPVALVAPLARLAVPGPLARLALLAIVAALALPLAGALHPLAAAPFDLPVARAAGPGQLVKAPDLASEAELVRFEPELLAALLRAQPGERLRIADWPVAPGIRRDVILARHDIYAPGARVLRVDAAGSHELPRSRLIFFWGIEADDPLSGIYVALDPANGTVESLGRSSGGTQQQLRPLVAGKPGLHLLATPEAFLAGQGAAKKPTWSCAENEVSLGPPPAEAAARSLPGLAELSGPVTTSSIYNLATVAIDTDHEFMSLKFSDNTTAATNYIASLFAQINVMYERDLQVQLLVGTTILRTASVADPYTQQPGSSGAATGAELTEFSNYWAANYGPTVRSVAAMLSGKSTSPYFASGIAWVGSLCNQGYGYSFSQIFLIDYLAGDALIVGHEIGHNFGSVHTHCYSPPIDDCYNLEPGCYSGPESCPAPTTINGVANVYGTIMGYCHLLGGCSTEMVFHPRTVAVIGPNIQGALGVCITPGNIPPPPPAVTAIAPNHGSTAGGTAVTITGSNFQSGATVTLGGVAATAVSVVNSSTLTASTGAHATGTVDVVVTSGGTPVTLSHAYFYAPPAAASRFYTLTPCRLVDTRNATGPYGGPALAAQGQRFFQLTGQCGIPAGAAAVSVNVTVVAAGAGNFALYPGNALPLGTSTLNFSAGQTRANNAVLQLATDGTGTVGVFNTSAAPNQFLLDVNGYFQ
jgi:Metallo-peptidase family M12/IPT/TIG domain